ncbi:hypothetical protein WR25_16808 [Diploscapter pachys]|uniref:Uncharacterized protein n=1 Tax=Diploscapter pachys TaxID=2018661 RepID=A0A2A2M3P0_9BILA|nr:hypothetical protein WR25_16808 [Diploscapter pachys]
MSRARQRTVSSFDTNGEPQSRQTHHRRVFAASRDPSIPQPRLAERQLRRRHRRPHRLAAHDRERGIDGQTQRRRPLDPTLAIADRHRITRLVRGEQRHHILGRIGGHAADAQQHIALLQARRIGRRRRRGRSGDRHPASTLIRLQRKPRPGRAGRARLHRQPRLGQQRREIGQPARMDISVEEALRERRIARHLGEATLQLSSVTPGNRCRS